MRLERLQELVDEFSRLVLHADIPEGSEPLAHIALVSRKPNRWPFIVVIR